MINSLRINPRGLMKPSFRGSLVAIAMLMVFAIQGVSQVHDCGNSISIDQPQTILAFGESVNIGITNESHAAATWDIQPTKGVSKSSGTGNYTDAITFNHPGKYTVTFSVPGHAPAKALVEVSDIKMIFDLNSVSFSQPIQRGVSTEGTTVSIKVNVKTSGKPAIQYGPCKTQTTGATGIVATLSEQVALKEGENIITFQLSGTTNTAGNAQIGFFNLIGEGFYYNFLIAE